MYRKLYGSWVACLYNYLSTLFSGHKSNFSFALGNSYIYVICRPGGPYWKKTVPEVLSTARGRNSFSDRRTDLGRKITCLCFSLWKVNIRNICVDFLLKQFHTTRVRLTFRSGNPCCLQKYLKEKIQFSLILELSNDGFPFHGDFKCNKKLLK